MHLFILIVVTTFWGIQHSFGQTNLDFPKMSVKSLGGKSSNIPDSIIGKKSLIMLTFSPKSEKYMEAWLTPLYNLFVGQKNNPLNLDAEEDQPNLVFVPMVTGIYQLIDDKVYEKLKSGIIPEFQPYVLFYSGPLKPYKESLKFGAKDVPYFYVLDKSGKIIHSTFGEYSEVKMDEILRFLE